MISAEQIKKARQSLGESQATFGARFGVDQSTVHRWETDAAPRRGPALLALKGLLADLDAQSQGVAAQ